MESMIDRVVREVLADMGQTASQKDDYVKIIEN